MSQTPGPESPSAPDRTAIDEARPVLKAALLERLTSQPAVRQHFMSAFGGNPQSAREWVKYQLEQAPPGHLAGPGGNAPAVSGDAGPAAPADVSAEWLLKNVVEPFTEELANSLPALAESAGMTPEEFCAQLAQLPDEFFEEVLIANL